MLRRKGFKWLLSVMLILVLIVLTACGGGSKDDGEDKTAPPADSQGSDNTDGQQGATGNDDEVITLRFSNWAQSETYDRVNEAFNEEFPNIKIEWVFSNGHGAEHFANILTENLAAGTPIDVYFNSSFLADVLNGYAADLTPFIENDPEFQAYEFLPGMLENFNVNGKQYALPRGTEVFLMYYNKDLLEELGLEKPSYDWTWDDFREMAIAATNPQEGLYGFGNSILNYLYGPLILTSAANGSSDRIYALNEDMTEMLSATDNVLDDLTWAYDLIYRDGVALNGLLSNEEGITSDLWMDGKALFQVHVSPLMENWAELSPLDFEWDVLPMPRGTDRQVTLLWSQPLFMTAASKHKEAVWEFMKWYTTSDTAQHIFLEKGTLLPNTQRQETVDYFHNLPFYEKFDTDAIMYSLEIGEIDPNIIMLGGNEVINVFQSYANELWANGTNPYDYFPAATEQANVNIEDIRAAFEQLD